MSTLWYDGPHERLGNSEHARDVRTAFISIVSGQGVSPYQEISEALSSRSSEKLADLDLAHMSECEACQMDHEEA